MDRHNKFSFKIPDILLKKKNKKYIFLFLKLHKKSVSPNI